MQREVPRTPHPTMTRSDWRGEGARQRGYRHQEKDEDAIDIIGRHVALTY